MKCSAQILGCKQEKLLDIFSEADAISVRGREDSSIFHLGLGLHTLEIEAKHTMFHDNCVRIHGYYLVLESLISPELINSGGEIVVDLYPKE